MPDRLRRNNAGAESGIIVRPAGRSWPTLSCGHAARPAMGPPGAVARSVTRQAGRAILLNGASSRRTVVARKQPMNAELRVDGRGHIFAMYRFDTSARDTAEARDENRVNAISGQKGSEASMTSQRSGVLELAVLGLLHETPMHGYELRKRLNSMLGAFRAFGYGSLYPCLKLLLGQGLIAEDVPEGPAKPLAGRRSKIVYRLTADGKERLQQLLAESGPAAWDDDGFGVHFAFFGQTQADIRLRILEGRRSRLEERLDGVR